MATKAQAKIALAHVCMGRGGSEAAAMWGLQALTRDRPVDLLTAGEPDLAEMNAAYGTAVDAQRVRIRQAPPIAEPVPGSRRINAGAALRAGRFQRFCRSAADEYDVLISAYNLCDFGMPAIHFIGDFCWDAELRASYDAVPSDAARLIHRETPLRKAYLALAKQLRKPSGRDLFAGEDTIVANSKWTAGVLKDKYGVECEVVYPPVPGEFPDVPWDEREHGFVCLGRVAHEKRIENVIEIVRRVRQLGHAVHLHLIGPIGDDPYGRKVRTLVEQHRDWIVPDGQRFGAEKAELLSRHRFAIHGRPGEAFGIAVAEQLKAGCIPFVPDSGGQTEIVDHDALCYGDPDDAVARIDGVLRDEARQHTLREHLGPRAEQFSAARFMREFWNVVERFSAGVFS